MNWLRGVKVTIPGTLRKPTQEHVQNKEVANICLTCDKPVCERGTCSRLKKQLKELARKTDNVPREK